MAIKNSVFGSTTERSHYYKLLRKWSNDFSIYPNLPFLLLFDVSNRSDLSKGDHEYLKKTSIDYVLCDQWGCPLIGIDFDGMRDGWNVGRVWEAEEPSDAQEKHKWKIRKLGMETKLRVAYSEGFPYFVVGRAGFHEIAEGVKYTIADGIIAEVMCNYETRKREGKLRVESQRLGITGEDELEWLMCRLGAHPYIVAMEYNPLENAVLDMEGLPAETYCGWRFYPNEGGTDEGDFSGRASRANWIECECVLRERENEKGDIWVVSLKY